MKRFNILEFGGINEHAPTRGRKGNHTLKQKSEYSNLVENIS